METQRANNHRHVLVLYIPPNIPLVGLGRLGFHMLYCRHISEKHQSGLYKTTNEHLNRVPGASGATKCESWKSTRYM